MESKERENEKGIERVETVEQYERLLQGHSKVVIHFWASWSEPSLETKQGIENGNEYCEIQFGLVQCEMMNELTQSLDVRAVPYTIFIKVKNL